MPNLLVIIYCLVDSGFWKVSDARAWADCTISKINVPKFWLINFSLKQTPDQLLQVIRDALREFSVVLPEITGELLVGFSILRFERGEISEQNLQLVISEIIDAYDEAELSFSGFEECYGEEYDACKEKALHALRFVEEVDIEAFATLVMD
ncbi:hypothetical protein KDD30_15405 [Photobacterium sp. GJ3]|uniref:hypothetical protein n=1 Tax=Photobacterium sp. GJ3 TaxID=2829502 RepID=UPI001B8A92E3|nr:hypothetical protein [Photobacterium sp. GJ3]QUJ67401.1 hypothetical protein KDD30_15405 [Photobacterium sp. GJ3]